MGACLILYLPIPRWTNFDTTLMSFLLATRRTLERCAILRGSWCIGKRSVCAWVARGYVFFVGLRGLLLGLLSAFDLRGAAPRFLTGLGGGAVPIRLISS